jgi:hypothetical protein
MEEVSNRRLAVNTFDKLLRLRQQKRYRLKKGCIKTGPLVITSGPVLGNISLIDGVVIPPR